MLTFQVTGQHSFPFIEENRLLWLTILVSPMLVLSCASYIVLRDDCDVFARFKAGALEAMHIMQVSLQKCI